MKTSYFLEIECQCPADPSVVDQYQCTIKASFMIRVEDIKAAVTELTRQPMFQEDLAQALARKLGADVKLEGEHQNVWTECEVILNRDRSESGVY